MRVYHDALTALAMPDLLVPAQWARSWGINVHEITGEKLLCLMMLRHCWDDLRHPPQPEDSYQRTLDRLSALAWLRGVPSGRMPFRLCCEALDIDPDWFREHLRRQLYRRTQPLTLLPRLHKVDPSPPSSITPQAARGFRLAGRLRLLRQIRVRLG
jgi:hypothetical protein